jgi:hypothetical protein
MIEGKGLGGKRVNRLGLSITNKEENDLYKLATACNMKPAEMAWRCLRRCLYDPVILNEFQKEFCTQSAYKVRVVQDYKSWGLDYVLAGREDL